MPRAAIESDKMKYAFCVSEGGTVASGYEVVALFTDLRYARLLEKYCTRKPGAWYFIKEYRQ